MTRSRLVVLGVAAAVVSAGTVGAMRSTSEGGTWQEMAWPFPRDAWAAGRAFRCDGAACGGAMELYVRPKIGFCNCATGVTDDAEVDGVSDLDMIGADYVPQAAGEPIEIGGLRGRARSYRLTTPGGQVRSATGYALASKCDLVAIATIGPAANTPAARQGVTALLESSGVAAWIRQKLGRG